VQRVVALRLTNHIPGQEVGSSETIHSVLSLLAPATGSAAISVFELDLSNFSMPMWGLHGFAPTFRAHSANINATAALAGFVITHVEFLEYDLVQAQRYWINTRTPVMAR